MLVVYSKKMTALPVFKRFEKAAHCLSSISDNSKIKVTLTGRSRSTFYGYEIFEIIPFILIDNAIKYSPKTQDVEVHFNETTSLIKVAVKSIGPKCEKSELKKIFERSYRGKFASHIEGSGRGLYLAKQICDINNIDIVASWEPISCQYDRKDYGNFIINLSIPI